MLLGTNGAVVIKFLEQFHQFLLNFQCENIISDLNYYPKQNHRFFFSNAHTNVNNIFNKFQTNDIMEIDWIQNEKYTLEKYLQK